MNDYMYWDIRNGRDQGAVAGKIASGGENVGSLNQSRL